MFEKLLRKSWNPIIFRISSSILFLIGLLVLYFGSVRLIFNLNSNEVMFVLWVLWWPFLYITLFFLARAWCGFICPIGLANEIGNSYGKKKRNYFVKYSWLPFVLFFIIVLWEQISGLFTSAKITLIFLLTFFLSAFMIGIFNARWGFCKYFCPVGTLMGVFSRLSITGIRTDPEICKKCKTKDCIKGGKYLPCPMFNYVPNLRSNKDCLLCLNCIKNCPYDSARLVFLKPGEELNKKIGFNLYESLFIVGLIGLTVLLTSRGSQLFRFFEINSIWIRVFDFVFGIGTFMGIYLVISYFSSKNLKIGYKDSLITGGYVFLPFVFAVMFFLIVFGFITPLTNVNENLTAISKYSLLIIGGGWSIKLSWNFFNKKSWIYVLSVISLILFWILIIIPGPLSLVKEEGKVYYAKSGETVDVKLFSMGYEPSVIKVKAGSYITLNLSDKDIIHSFDIDALGVRTVLKGGESKLIKIHASTPGRYEYYCSIPGHKEAGMKGLLIVE